MRKRPSKGGICDIEFDGDFGDSGDSAAVCEVTCVDISAAFPNCLFRVNSHVLRHGHCPKCTFYTGLQRVSQSQWRHKMSKAFLSQMKWSSSTKGSISYRNTYCFTCTLLAFECYPTTPAIFSRFV